MKKALFILAIVGLVLSTGGVAEAVILNGGFETGDLSNWTVEFCVGSGIAQAVTSHTSDKGTVYNPIEGNYFAKISPYSGWSTAYVKLSQVFSISSGEWIEGWVAFDTWTPYTNTYVSVSIPGVSGIWWSNVSKIGAYGDGPWTYWKWVPPASGNYTLKVYHSAGGTQYNGGVSYVLFDAVKVVPEPATMLLLGSGLLGLAVLGRKRKSALR